MDVEAAYGRPARVRSEAVLDAAHSKRLPLMLKAEHGEWIPCVVATGDGRMPLDGRVLVRIKHSKPWKQVHEYAVHHSGVEIRVGRGEQKWRYVSFDEFDLGRREK